MGDYRKTSAEELTAMADQLREIGDFSEGQKFVFPSSEYDENPTITYWIYDSNETEPWIELTEQQASELSGYTEVEVSELPTTGEANILYISTIYQMGFAEAYQKIIDEFYQKVYHGTLTQEDIDGIVFDLDSINYFSNISLGINSTSYPTIKEISVTPDFLSAAQNCNRLSALKTVNVINSNNESITIGNSKFYGCTNLEKIVCSPIAIGSSAFVACNNLILGPGYLSLDLCQRLEYQCFQQVLVEEVSLPVCQSIKSKVFYRIFNETLLKKVYLPAVPPTLANIDAFQYYINSNTDGINPNLKFYVPNGAKVAYASATNWSSFIDGSLDGIDHFEELGGGN